MKLFWVTYISIACLGTLIVWFAAPLARPYVRDFFPDRQNHQNLSTTAAEEYSLVSEGTVFESDSVTERDRSSVSSVPSEVADTQSVDDPPALLGIFRVRGSEKPDWGVVRKKTNLYDEDGKRLGEVPAGLFVNFIESRKSSKGLMVLCRLQHKGAEHGPFLVSRSDLSLYTGDYHKLSADQLNNLEKYFKIMGLMEARKVELMQQIAQKNPFYPRYKTAYDAYMDHINTAAELTAERDDATGLQRSRIDDQLRRMKNEEANLKKAYDDIHQKYKDWKTANASELPDVATDATVAEYRQEMRRLAQLLPGMFY